MLMCWLVQNLLIPHTGYYTFEFLSTVAWNMSNMSVNLSFDISSRPQWDWVCIGIPWCTTITYVIKELSRLIRVVVKFPWNVNDLCRQVLLHMFCESDNGKSKTTAELLVKYRIIQTQWSSCKATHFPCRWLLVGLPLPCYNGVTLVVNVSWLPVFAP